MWIWLVLLYGILKGCREICKKKALLTCSSIEVLLIYTFVAFALVCPSAPQAMGMDARFFLPVAFKSFIIFVAWICSFKAIKHLPISLYGVLDLSRVLFTTSLGVLILHEHMGVYNIIGLILVGTGLVLLKFRPASTISEGSSVAPGVVIIALISCLLNGLSALMDKILMKDITSSQLQFWYMLFLCIYYLIYAVVCHASVNIKRAITNKWIWLLAIMFVIADRALFIANGMADSRITIMTLVKQSGCIVTILAGRYIFKEKGIAHKLVCAGVIIVGIVISTFSSI